MNIGFWLGLCAFVIGGLIGLAILQLKKKKDEEKA